MDKPSEMQSKLLEECSLSESTRETVISNFKEVNKKMREIGDLKGKNRVKEQQQLVAQMKENYHTYRNLSRMSGISLKTVHSWCAEPVKKINKCTEIANLRKKEFEQFLIQDTISFAHPCKKYSGKRFLRDTLAVTRTKYLQQ